MYAATLTALALGGWNTAEKAGLSAVAMSTFSDLSLLQVLVDTTAKVSLSPNRTASASAGAVNSPGGTMFHAAIRDLRHVHPPLRLQLHLLELRLFPLVPACQWQG